MHSALVDLVTKVVGGNDATVGCPRIHKKRAGRVGAVAYDCRKLTIP